MQRYLKFLAPLALTCLVSPTAFGIPVVNGGFETGDFTGWTQGGNLSSTFVENNTVGSPDAAHSGTFGAHLGPSGIPGTLSQTLNTTPGSAYQVQFWLSNINENGGSNTLNFFSVAFDGVTLFSQNDLPTSAGFDFFSFNATASGLTADLTFTFQHNPDHFFLDDVAVADVVPGAPELDPAMTSLPLTMLLAQALLLSSRRRRSSAEIS